MICPCYRLRSFLLSAALLTLLSWSRLGGCQGSQFSWRPLHGPAPISLVGPDGTQLRLVSLQVQTIVQPPLAFTELTLKFLNPEPRTIEGRFRIALPNAASVSRFAMKIGGLWQEGEMLEKQRARSVFEDFLHRSLDPALLEEAAGNEFSARVFPIPAAGEKELVIAYSHEVSSASPLLVALAGVGELEQLDVALHVPGGQPDEYHSLLEAPPGDLVFAASALESPQPVALRSQELVLAQVVAPALVGEAALENVVILVDTSASRKAELKAQASLARQLVRSVGVTSGARGQACVMAFDQTTQTIFQGRAWDVGVQLEQRLQQRGAWGATHLSHALRRVAKLGQSGGYRRLVLLTDGIVTSGSDARSLMAAKQALVSAGFERIDVVAYGAVHDLASLRSLVRAGMPHPGTVISATLPLQQQLARLRKPAHQELPVSVRGARWVYPSHLSGLQPGDTQLVVAELPAGGPLQIQLGAEPPMALLAKVGLAPLVRRAWAKAKIQSLLEAGGPDVEQEVIRLSTQHRVLSPLTALLVLERADDYDRYGIQRQALADILSIRNGRLVRTGRDVLTQRGALATRSTRRWDLAPGSAARTRPRQTRATSTTARRAPQRKPTSTRQHRVRAPKVRLAMTKVTGRLPPETVQRIVRLNYGRFRACYQRGLLNDPQLRGRVSVRFYIDRAGGVSYVAADSATNLTDARVVKCIVDAFYQLRFPNPEAQLIGVVYPLVLGTGTQPIVPMRATPRFISLPEPRTRAVPPAKPPYSGEFARIMQALHRRELAAALRLAQRFSREQPRNALASLALGQVLWARGQQAEATRVYGSWLDWFPHRAELLRFTGSQLESTGRPAARRLALDSYQKARRDRPDHVSGQRLVAYALLQERQFEAAFSVLSQALNTETRHRRGVKQILREDLGLIAAAWKQAHPTQIHAIDQRLEQVGGEAQDKPSLRFVLSWETDANDVDLHVLDAEGDQAFRSKPHLDSGGHLYADVSNGYGPECFGIHGPRAAWSASYRLKARYSGRGPMGFGLGRLQIVEHDGNGGLHIETRPFVVMNEGGMADLGEYRPKH